MRVLVVGAGAVGGYFGGRLAEVGRDVTFLLRPARAAQIERDGLQIVSQHGDACIRVPVVQTGALDGSYDVVLLATKAYGLDQAGEAEDVREVVHAAVFREQPLHEAETREVGKRLEDAGAVGNGHEAEGMPEKRPGATLDVYACMRIHARPHETARR